MFLKFLRLVCIIACMQFNSTVFSVSIVHLSEELKVLIASYAYPLAYTTQYFWQFCKIPLLDAQCIVASIKKEIELQASNKKSRKNSAQRRHFEGRLFFFFKIPLKKMQGIKDTALLFYANQNLFFLLFQDIKRTFHPSLQKKLFKNCSDFLCHYYMICSYQNNSERRVSLALQKAISSQVLAQLKFLYGKNSVVQYRNIVDIIYEQAALDLQVKKAGALGCNLL